MKHWPRDKQEAIEQFTTDEHLKDHIIMTEEGLPGYQLHAEEMIAEGDKVACRCQVIGTHTGILFGIPATGKTLRSLSISFIRSKTARLQIIGC